MELRHNCESLELSDIDPFLAELLRQIPDSTRPDGCAAARERLFSKPSKDQKTCREWRSLVEPELASLFQGATEVVSEDLRQLDGDERSFANRSLRIPLQHAEQWLNALNQARLVIAAKYDFTEEELSDQFRSPIGSRRDLGLFQVNFYGFLQEFLVRELNDDHD